MSPKHYREGPGSRASRPCVPLLEEQKLVQRFQETGMCSSRHREAHLCPPNPPPGNFSYSSK